jgi:hypothetical protein
MELQKTEKTTIREKARSSYYFDVPQDKAGAAQ